MSGFSFMSEEQDSDVEESRPTESESGFGFITGDKTDSDEEEEEQKSGRGEVFGEDEDHGAERSLEEDGGHASSSHDTVVPVSQEANHNTEEKTSPSTEPSGDKELSRDSQSGFGFLINTEEDKSSTEPSPTKQNLAPDIFSQIDTKPLTPTSNGLSGQSRQEIKLASSSTATKVARKKKRTSKVGSRRNADIVNESEVPQSPKLPSVSEVAEQPTTEHHPPTPSSTAQSEVPIETQASSPAAEHSVQSMSATLEKKNNVVHLSEKPPMSNSASKSVSDKADTMSDISEDNSSINSSRSAPVERKSKGGGFLSFFSRKKEVVEHTKPPESSQPYKPNTKAAKNLVVQHVTNTEPHENVHVDGYSFEPHPESSHSEKSVDSPSLQSERRSDNEIPTNDISPLPVKPQQDSDAENKRDNSKVEEKNALSSQSSQPQPPQPQSQPQVPVSTDRVSPRPEDEVLDVPKSPKPILKQDDKLCIKIRELSRDVILSFKSSVRDISEYQATLLQDMRDHLHHKEKAEMNSRVVLQNIKEIEEEQGRLAEAEEFEQADALSSQLDQLRQEYSNAMELIKTSSQAYEDAESSLKECRRELSSKMNETAHGLGNLIRQEIEELDNLMSVNSKALADEDSRVSAEEERISIELSHVEREQATLAEETDVIENAITSQTVDAQKDKEGMEMELMGVNSEVERLEKELALKKQEQKMLEMNLLVAEGKIREVRKKYDRQLQRIADRSATVESSCEECKQEHEAIKVQRLRFTEEKNKLSEIESSVSDYIKAMEKERDIASHLKETFDSILLNSTVTKPVAGKDAGTQTNGSIVSVREKVTATESALEKAMLGLENLRSSIASLGEEDSTLKEKIPLLEVEKKSHASNKRFKEAASTAKDIKSMTARREEISSLVTEKESQIGGMEKDIEDAREEAEKARAELKAAERDVDLARLDDLRNQAISLRKACRVAENEKDSAQEIIIATIAIDLLTAELKVVLDEASEIKEKHDLDIDLLVPLEEEDNEDEKECESGSASHDDETPDRGESSDIEKQNSDNASCDDVTAEKESPDTDVDEEQSINEDCNDDNASERSNPQQEDDLLPQAQAMLQSLKSLENDLEVAVDTEEYDDAATISEKVDELTEQFDGILSKLGVTRKEVEETLEENV